LSALRGRSLRKCEKDGLMQRLVLARFPPLRQ
jgi:hypothetical protein